MLRGCQSGMRSETQTQDDEAWAQQPILLACHAMHRHRHRHSTVIYFTLNVQMTVKFITNLKVHRRASIPALMGSSSGQRNCCCSNFSKLKLVSPVGSLVD
ncbi:hypothetical protein SAY87_008283 [Trapa incisa]|uniref:Uncharacterized protein n=1 Tax=Trapa incisa TaxID=236973 RepID=A0AAN7KMD1_9MYRT|nr:hypothetical protein SAY87_008283 [Trapa incisa]